MSGSNMHHAWNDVFRRGGLGLTGGRVWLLILSETGLKTSEVAARLDFDRGTARRHLNRLKDHDMCSKAGHPAQWSGRERDLYEVALELGTAAYSEIARQRHATQRKGYHSYLDWRRRRDNKPL